MARVRYSFTFPYRWLKEDRAHLKKNLENSIRRNKNQVAMHPTLIGEEPMVNVYGVKLKQHSYQPKVYKMDKDEITELLDGVFPGAKCLAFEKFFVQKEFDSGLPVMEMEIFY